MADDRPLLLTSEDAENYRTHRQAWSERLGVSTIEQLDAQMTWWMIKNVFNRYPDLGAFELGDIWTEINEDNEAYPSLSQLQVAVFAMPGVETQTENHSEILSRARMEIKEALIGYGLISSEGLYDLVVSVSQGRTRESLDGWDWGQFGPQWVPARTQTRLDQQLPQGIEHTPKPRI